MPLTFSVSTETESGVERSEMTTRWSSSLASWSDAPRAIRSALTSTVEPSTASTSIRPFTLEIETSPVGES
jgi:hypothetical protein